MVKRRIEAHTANILIKMEGEGDWAAKKEEIDGAETIVFFRKKRTSSPLQALRDQLDHVMSGTAAANKYLKKLQINKSHVILKDLQDPNKKKISKESLNSYMHNLHSIAEITSKSNSRIENISNTEKWADNFFSVFEIISFKESEDSEKALNLIKLSIKNHGGPAIPSGEKINIIRHINFALDNSYQNKSIQEQIQYKKKCNEAYKFLRKINLPESSAEKKGLDELIKKIKVIENIKPSKNPEVIKESIEIAAACMEYFHETMTETEIDHFIKFIDVATCPPAYNLSAEEKKQFIKLCTDARLRLTIFSKSLDPGSDLQKKLYILIGNLDVALGFPRLTSGTKETKDFLADSLKSIYKLGYDKERRQNIDLAVDNFYGLAKREKSQENIKNFAAARLELRNIKFLLSEEEVRYSHVDSLLDDLLKALDKTINELQQI